LDLIGNGEEGDTPQIFPTYKNFKTSYPRSMRCPGTIALFTLHLKVDFGYKPVFGSG